jgi:hypothetical protein
MADTPVRTTTGGAGFPLSEDKSESPLPITNADANPTTFGASGGTAPGIKYNVEQLRYPKNVANSPDMRHYMGFFINIRGKSKYKANYKSVEVNRTDEQSINREALDTVIKTGLTVGTAVVGGKLGYSAATKFFATAGQNAPNAVKVVGTVGATAAAAYAGYQAGGKVANYFESDKTFRISDAIMLAVQEKPSVTYGVNYQAKDMGTLAGGLAAAVAGGQSFADTAQSALGAEAARAMLLNAAQIPSGIANAIGASEFDAKAAASIGTGTALNPFREQIFQSVDTRTFKFDYKFLPRSGAESENVWRIINRFKFHMHPELSAGGLFYIYPSEFNIVYYYNNVPNPTLFNISTCVLENMTVDYGGQQWGSFNDGYPTEINISLKFVELEVLTKERINLGY